MYTLRPLLSYQYFVQASILYQLYMKSTHRLANDISLLGQIPITHNAISDGKQRRIEESMYWSCFKSESEFRVELPLPQTELATYYHPQLFPSPPSPANVDQYGGLLVASELNGSLPSAAIDNTKPSEPTEAASLRQHAKQLCQESESWYYYLTEIALRRIGNRVINTFFNQDFLAWLNIKPWLSIALEFDVSHKYSIHYPPRSSLTTYATDSSLRLVRPSSKCYATLGDQLHNQSADADFPTRRQWKPRFPRAKLGHRQPSTRDEVVALSALPLLLYTQRRDPSSPKIRCRQSNKRGNAKPR